MACAGSSATPYVPHDVEGWDNLAFAPFEQVVAEADFLSLHCILTPETDGLLDAEAIGRMKRSAILVNVSRGKLINQADLVAALAKQTIAGAGLDVFANEPLTQDDPLHHLPNVVLTPHFAFYSREAHERLEGECLAAITELLAGRLPKNVKNCEALQRHGHPPPTSDDASRRPPSSPPGNLRAPGVGRDPVAVVDRRRRKSFANATAMATKPR